ncbi:MAG: PAS domain-containing sensor histidine kinase [Flavobacteriales bacterium]|nr:PAS domain-containing sensor histidine kinase [Flavobacteriales bacterium]
MAFGLCFPKPDWLFSQLVLLLFIIGLSINLYQFLTRTNRDVSRILGAIQYNDFNAALNNHAHGARYDELVASLKEVKDGFEAKSFDQEVMNTRLSRVIELSQTGIMVFDSQRNLLLCNSAFESLFGLKDIQSFDLFERYFSAIAKQLTEASNHAQFKVSNKENNFAMVSDLILKIEKFKSSDGLCTVVFAAREDLLSDHQDYESWLNFGKVISHEIQNGISPFVSLISTLKDKVSNMEGNELSKQSSLKALGIMQDRTESLQQFAERYRTLHRLPEPNKSVLTWATILDGVVEQYQAELDEKGVKLEISGDEIDGVVRADEWQMNQVFSNLLINSLHAFDGQSNQNEKVVSIHVTASMQNYLISFKDNGVGIKKDHYASIFVPFFSTRKNGSGIGLSVSRQILWKHGADIFLQHSEEGADFRIRFPYL